MPGSSACSLLPGMLGSGCRAVNGASAAVSFAADPLGAIAAACAKATVWIWGQLAAAINATTQVDLTNPGFLNTYALVFAVSSILVVLLWLVAVAKRVVRGVGAGQAVGESVGLLALAVAASALAPAMLELLMGLVDAATAGLAGGLGPEATRFLTGAGNALTASGTTNGGPVVLIFGAIIGVLVGVLLWVELLLAAAAIYVAAVFGPLVFAGLVDRAMWGHVRRWIGLVVSLALVKPVVVVVLGLAAGLAGSGSAADNFSSVLTAIALLLLSTIASYAVYRLVPLAGDELGQLHGARKAVQSSGPAAAVPGPATLVSQGIAAHMRNRGSGGRSGPAPAAPPSAPPPAPRTQPPRPTPPPGRPTPAPATASGGTTP
jgi:hypothetical protein